MPSCLVFARDTALTTKAAKKKKSIRSRIERTSLSTIKQNESNRQCYETIEYNHCVRMWRLENNHESEKLSANRSKEREHRRIMLKLEYDHRGRVLLRELGHRQSVLDMELSQERALLESVNRTLGQTRVSQERSNYRP